MVVLQGYNQIEKKAEGGMAVLYRGVQTSLNRPVAIKFLKHDIAEDVRIRRLFEAESQIIARLDHPNIIRVIDKGVVPSGQPYFIMDYVEGTDLKQALKQGELSYPRKLRIIIQVAKALAYAHRNGVIHRDIKPGNVLIDSEGNARIADFGVAFFAGGEDDTLAKGTAVGTPAYMAPEQREGAEFATPCSDIYSLGVLMYVLFTGKTPKDESPLVHVVNGEISEGLSKLVWQCMLPDPKKRPQSADDVVRRVLSVVRGAHLKPQQMEKANKIALAANEKFILIDVLKEDDFSTVYLYENREDASLLILKKCNSDALGYQENKLLSHLKHKNLINVLGVTKNDRIFIAIMEYVSGGNLRSRLARPMTVEEFLPLGLAISDAMSFAHQNRVLHGNLRPQNVLFTDKGQVKITDFGFRVHYSGKNQKNWYCVQGESASVKGDVYAAGVMFYQMLVGYLPRWTLNHLNEQKRFQELPGALQRLLLAMLSRKVSERIENFDTVLKSLKLVEDSLHEPEMETVLIEPISIRRPSRWPRRIKLVLKAVTAFGVGYGTYRASSSFDLLAIILGKF